MGIGLTFSLCMAVLGKGGVRKFGWVVVSAAIAVPLVLSGVRSSLLAVVVCVALLALTRAKGFARIALVLFLVAGYQLLSVVISRFGGQSTILSQDRYSDLSNDTSLTARLELLNYLTNPFRYLIGDPNVASVDNLYIDVLVKYGLAPAIALFAMAIVVAVRATQLLRRHRNETAALCVWFILVQSMFGNIFNALVGILVGVIIGTVMSKTSDRESYQTEPFERKRVLFS
jgi:O-antigen ligase